MFFREQRVLLVCFANFLVFKSDINFIKFLLFVDPRARLRRVSTLRQAFRTDEGVDVGSAAGEFYVGWIREHEFLRYSVDVTSDGKPCCI